tara:strand:- start:672 stop:836 length:165 start_codon:yes stop_codon:yes gene_type:complete
VQADIDRLLVQLCASRFAALSVFLSLHAFLSLPACLFLGFFFLRFLRSKSLIPA